MNEFNAWYLFYLFGVYIFLSVCYLNIGEIIEQEEKEGYHIMAINHLLLIDSINQSMDECLVIV